MPRQKEDEDEDPIDLTKLSIPIMDQVQDAIDTIDELKDDPIIIPTESTAREPAKVLQFSNALITYSNYFNELDKSIEVITQSDKLFAEYVSKFNNDRNRLAIQKAFNTFKDTVDLTPKKRQYRNLLRNKRTTLESIRSGLAVEKIKADAANHTGPVGGPVPARTGTGSNAPPANIIIKPFRNDKTQTFRTFWNLFSVAYDTNTHMSDVNKLITLISLLEGEPQRIVESVDITDANYKVVVADLKRRYLNEGTIISELYFQLSNLKPCNSPVDEYNFSITLENIAKQLKGLNKGIDNSEMWRTLELKLTKPTMREIERRRQKMQEEETQRAALARDIYTDPWTTATFIEVLSSITAQEHALHQMYITEHRLKSNPQTNRNSQRSNSNYQNRKNSAQEDSTMSFSSVTKESNRKDKKEARSPVRKSEKTEDSNRSVSFVKCAFCDGNHKNYSCKTYTSELERKKQAYTNRLCFRCLHTGHLTGKCTTNITCKKCKKPHHTLVCSDWRPNVDSKRPNRNSNATSNVVVADKPESSTLEQLISGAATTVNTMALLMTLEIPVFNPSNAKRRTTATVLLDPGSQSSFVKKSLVEKLGIESRTSQKLHLSGINALERADIESNEVELGLHSENGFVKIISAHTLDQIVHRTHR